MKTIMRVVLLSAMVGAMMAPVYAQVLFTDSFESDTLGVAPTGWVLTGVSGSTRTITVENVNLENSLHMYDQETGGGITATYTFASPGSFSEGNATLDINFDMMIASLSATGSTNGLRIMPVATTGTQQRGLLFQDSSGSIAVFHTGNGALGGNLLSFGTWYHVTMSYSSIISGGTCTVTVKDAATQSVAGTYSFGVTVNMADVGKITYVTSNATLIDAYINDISVAIVAIPEVSTGVMLGVGLLGIGCVLARREWIAMA